MAKDRIAANERRIAQLELALRQKAVKDAAYRAAAIDPVTLKNLPRENHGNA